MCCGGHTIAYVTQTHPIPHFKCVNFIIYKYFLDFKNKTVQTKKKKKKFCRPLMVHRLPVLKLWSQ